MMQDNLHKLAQISNHRFIVFEGGESTGKSSQLKLLAYCLKQSNIDVATSREPGGSAEAELIRNVILTNNLDNLSNLLLFVASRRENLLNNILHHLDKNMVVLCDRYLLSSIVYQCEVNNVDKKLVMDLHKSYNFNFFPALTFVFDCDVQTSIARMQKRGVLSTFDAKSVEFHDKINTAYQKNYDFYLSKIVKINASASLELVHNHIVKALAEHLNLDIKPLKPEQISQCLI